MGLGQEDQDRQDEIDAACAALKAELSTSQAREVALREKLEAYTLTPENYEWTIKQLSERAEAAEARIKASQEQEPFYYMYQHGDGSAWRDEYTWNGVSPTATLKLYAQPPIPPELAELQREIERMHKDVAYYSEKLTEVTRRHCDEIDKNAELRKLLEESKVPDDSAIISNELVRFLNGSDCIDGVWFGDEHPQYRGRFWWRKLLPTQPKEPKQ